MASNSSKKNKSSGLRMLWIPGRKSHSKGRLSTTNKHISYSTNQKKSEVWTLGGSKLQNELIDLPSPETNGASTSTLGLVGAMSSTLVKNVKADSQNRDHVLTDDFLTVSECATLPTTPVAAISPNLNSPLSELAPSTPSTTAMASPIVVTTVGILDLHNIIGPDDLPRVPTTELSTSAVILNSSAGTTASITTNSSPLANRKATVNSSSQNASPQKQGRYKIHNNNQDDIHSIESISSYGRTQVNNDFDWIDEMEERRACNEIMHKNKRKKSKKILDKESDQLDGFKPKELYDVKSVPPYEDNDEKVVKCLYYSLMCCDCTIS